jgi:hypothetical protein
MNERQMKVFQYYADSEDQLCPYEAIEDFGFWESSRIVFVPCYGEVWTDQEMNILRMSKRLDLSSRMKEFNGWEDVYVILTYGWLNRSNEAPRLAPLTIYSEARTRKHMYWCKGHFTDYQMFSVGTKVGSD